MFYVVFFGVGGGWGGVGGRVKIVQSKQSVSIFCYYLFAKRLCFLSDTSNCMHSSLHLSIWSPRFTTHKLYLRCRSFANRAKRSFHFGPPKINDSNSNVSLLWLHNLEKNGKEV